MNIATSTEEDDGRDFSQLSALGIHSPEQLLLHLPKSYDDFTKIDTVAEFQFDPSDYTNIMVVVDSHPNLKGVQPPRLTMFVRDAEKRMMLTVFGMVQEWKKLRPGMDICVRARLKVWNDYVQLENPELIPFERAGRISANYPGKKGEVTSATIASHMHDIFQSTVDDAVTYISRHFDGMSDHDILANAKVSNIGSLRQLLQKIHFPESMQAAQDALAGARRIAAFEALYNARKRQLRKPDPKSIVQIRPSHVQSLIERLPFALTEAQRKAVDDMVDDMGKPYTMYRLVSGDVGSGKTEPLLIAAAAARAANAKVAILVPNLLLARQAINRAQKYWPKVPVVMAAGKSKIDLAGDPIVIGTTAMFKPLEKAGWTPNVMIVDEQAKFARSQRERLAETHTNLVEATATCIPRTAALVLNGGMDLTVINQCPVQKNIHSRIVHSHQREPLLNHLRKLLGEGGQVAIIYPNVSSSEKKRGNVTTAYEMWEKHFPGQVGILHGNMTDEEKLAVIEAMEQRKFGVLVTSTIIEIGITLPSLRGLVVVEADRFGVSQLHQLRGRLARNGGVGYFFMYLPKEAKEDSLERLHLVERENDGFKLSEMDMELRGFGDLSEDSDRQHGVLRSSLFTGVKLRPSDIRALS